ncbi:uncharacterized protein Z518_02211 [Rhinocladiella mackenziei CBS 650.93]|uniref:Uncharacterized protein n=1 Tax=Rhinocladiella mackenziei CBS 650.93 TaxID=1442369 RepID=A0A0D2HAU6_9EURO|nr:uncharacterized protein Z518_02211 [Rhinocladiella mackenziei CBS 650.93]KIX07558.1 hypothetical protein Z518_02211 [Rhinocladiella mackenziei CBS 650.93]
MTLRPTSTNPPGSVTLLILGAGWTYQFLSPLLTKENISYAATTTTGRDGTIPFRFDPQADDKAPFEPLPFAAYVLVTFPLKGSGASRTLVDLYAATHSQSHSDGQSGFGGNDGAMKATKWIQLGSTGIYTTPDWNDSSSAVDASNERCVAEDELLMLGGCVLNLAGLYGGSRDPKNWVVRVAKTKEHLGAKGALHLVHGVDVARAVVGTVSRDIGGQKDRENEEKKSLFGRRWIVADCVSYDWWSLVWDWMGESEDDGGIERDTVQAEEKSKYRRWIIELMAENNVRGLPRSVDALGRKLDAREFWTVIGIVPEMTLRR